MKGKLRWLGLACVEYVTDNGKVILFDPWTKTDGNECSAVETSELQNVDLVLLSHDHFDHVGSVMSICQQTNAMLGGPDETMQRLMKEEDMPREQIINDGNGYIVGGGAVLPWITIKAVPAMHTSVTSHPIGTIARFNDGTTIYHTGDTGLTADMEAYTRLYPVDVVMLPLMPRCNMDLLQAVEAVRMIRPRVAIPIHYDVPENPKTIAEEFKELCNKFNPWVRVVLPEKKKYYSLEEI